MIERMKRIPFNLNDYIRVQLTDEGRRIYREWHDLQVARFHGIGEYMLKEDADGWSVWKMWRLMEVFGGYFDPHNKLPLNMNVEIEVCE